MKNLSVLVCKSVSVLVCKSVFVFVRTRKITCALEQPHYFPTIVAPHQPPALNWTLNHPYESHNTRISFHNPSFFFFIFTQTPNVCLKKARNLWLCLRLMILGPEDLRFGSNKPESTNHAPRHLIILNTGLLICWSLDLSDNFIKPFRKSWEAFSRRTYII